MILNEEKEFLQAVLKKVKSVSFVRYDSERGSARFRHKPTASYFYLQVDASYLYLSTDVALNEYEELVSQITELYGDATRAKSGLCWKKPTLDNRVQNSKATQGIRKKRVSLDEITHMPSSESKIEAFLRETIGTDMGFSVFGYDSFCECLRLRHTTSGGEYSLGVKDSRDAVYFTKPIVGLSRPLPPWFIEKIGIRVKAKKHELDVPNKTYVWSIEKLV